MKSLKGKNVLIFGGLGLIGSSVARIFIAQGAEVTIADNRTPVFGANDFNVADLEGKFKLILGDIRSKEFVDQAVVDKDYILNFAAQIDHNRSIQDPLFDNELNCIGHLNVLMACRNNNPEAVLFYPGSRLQYGKTTVLPVPESHPSRPLSIYGIHKSTAEQYYQIFWRAFKIPSICFRITNPYGPRSQMKNSGYSLINWFIRQALDRKPITVFGDGHELRDYIYIDDLAEAIVIAMRTPECAGKIYNIGSGQGTRFVDMARQVATIAGQTEVVLIPWPEGYDRSETFSFYADISALTSDTTWRPETSLPDGIQKTVSYYQEYRDRYWAAEESVKQ